MKIEGRWVCCTINVIVIIKKIEMGGKWVWPVIDGGKGIGFTDGVSAGLWAREGGIGTFSAAAANYFDEQGNVMLYTFKSKTRLEKHEELIKQEIKGAIAQARIAYEMSQGNGLVNLNILWEMGGTKRILEGMLPHAAQYLNAITAGAGIPYDLGPIAAKYGLGYLPIVSSARVMKVLWKRSFEKYAKYLQAVVYEDPWKAGGHNGLSNKENPLMPEDPKPRVKDIREFLNSVDMAHVPIVMAGNVWHLNEWRDFIDDPELQPIAFQFGTRTLVTQENPAQISMKMAFLKAGMKKQMVHLHNFSPTGFYSSALENSFLKGLMERSNRQVAFVRVATNVMSYEVKIGTRGRSIFVSESDGVMVEKWILEGFSAGLPTPDNTMVFVSEVEAKSILEDQRACKGCLKGCRFSGWYEEGDHSTGIAPDPRSFCIFNTLYAASHGGDVDLNLMFAGKTVNRFSDDVFYRRECSECEMKSEFCDECSNDMHEGFCIPTISELFKRVLSGY